MDDFLDLVDLAAERLGGSALAASDDFFAEKENLLKADKPIFVDGKYTDRGKWMDGWESRRRRPWDPSPDAHDWCIVRLGLSGVVRGVVVDTAFFRGNYPAACAIDAACLDGHPDVATLTSDRVRWCEIVARSPLEGDAQNRFAVTGGARVTHLRLRIYPDGGVARLRVHGEVVADPRWAARGEVDLAAIEHGGRVVASSDMFFGSRHNLVMPGRGVNMGDGWETKRSRTPGPDWAVVRLGAAGEIRRVEVDTAHFKGNAPDSCAIAVCDLGDVDAAGDAATPWSARAWTEVLARTPLQPHTRHVFEREIAAHPRATHARLSIWPDGGVSRLRLFGTVARDARLRAGVERLGAMDEADANAALLGCCASRRWAKEMLARRSWKSFDALREDAAAIWKRLDHDDWHEAFRAHPRIGETKKAPAANATSARWSGEEQAGVAGAEAATLAELAAKNAAYEAKFGHVYLVCATGKSAAELLAILTSRLGGTAEAELARAADEQAKITALRLEKLVLG